jgi:hypothetical protein
VDTDPGRSRIILPDADPYPEPGSESGSELFDIKFILYSLVPWYLSRGRLPGT